MTVAGILFAIVALLLVAAIPAVVEFLALSKRIRRFLALILPWPILIIAMIIALAGRVPVRSLARVRPNGDGESGSVVATGLWRRVNGLFFFTLPISGLRQDLWALLWRGGGAAEPCRPFCLRGADRRAPDAEYGAANGKRYNHRRRKADGLAR